MTLFVRFIIPSFANSKFGLIKILSKR